MSHGVTPLRWQKETIQKLESKVTLSSYLARVTITQQAGLAQRLMLLVCMSRYGGMNQWSV